MIHPRSFRFLTAAAALALPSLGAAAPVISEIMFHSAAVPENIAQEWLEIYNPDAVAAPVGNWQFTKGVAFTIPAGTVIPANGYLVVAANVAVFQALHPTVTNVVGGWTGNLSDSGETIRLADAAGVQVDQVDYFTEGDWATRARGADDLGHKGWIWVNPADGGGKSMELVSAALHKNNGQNWKASTTTGGTPGVANSVAAADGAPVLLAMKHHPLVPHATEPVQVSCDLSDEAGLGLATLHWRLDAGTWQTLPMADSDFDGEVDATIPAQADKAVVEFYVSATDGTNSRTWPAPARTSDVGVVPETYGQVTNCLYQVENSFNAAEDFKNLAGGPLYRFVMTEAERAELANIGSALPQADSDAAMNTTFIIQDGRGMEVHYRAETRNRGTGSRVGPPNNYYLGLPNDDPWGGRVSAQFNCQYPHSQAIGALMFQLAGIAAQEATPVRIHVNGTDLAQPAGIMFGHYVRIEPANGAWVKEHFPNDPDGNVYRLDDHAPGTVGVPVGNLGSGEFKYEGTDPAAYSDTYIKKTNEELNDYSDLAALCKVISAPITGGTVDQPAITDANYVAELSAKINLDQWLTFFATDAVIGNQEGGLQSGRADDAGMYRGVVDQRFFLLPHDFDAVFNLGLASGNPVTRSIFSYDNAFGSTTPGTGVVGLTRLFNHPDIVPLYYAKVLEQMDKWFNRATLDPMLDRLVGAWVPAATLTNIKAFIDNRRANLLTQIPTAYSLIATTAGTAIEGFNRTNDGAATISGNFNVAATHSILVNGVAATLSYKTVTTPAATAGTWSLAVPIGGGSVLRPGTNTVTALFYSGKNGTGTVLQTLTATIIWQPVAATYTNVSGTLSGGAASSVMSLLAPDSYLPGYPVLVRVDLKNPQGNLDRDKWNTTVNLTASNGVSISPTTVDVKNGMGSALITIGSSGGPGATTTLIQKGGTAASPNLTAPTWKWHSPTLNTAPANDTNGKAWNAVGYLDSAWDSGTGELGYEGAGNTQDQRTTISNVTSIAAGGTARRTWYFRHTFNVANPAVFNALTLKLLADDGAAIYLNGTEITAARRGLPAGAITYTTFANRSISGSGTTPLETEFETIDITSSLNLLTVGTNTIAVEMHNALNSVDLSFDLELIGTEPGAPTTNPGPFTLNATAAGASSATKNFTSLFGVTERTIPAGNLAGGDLVWGDEASANPQKIIHLAGSVTVPTGSTLTIHPGTHILLPGTPGLGDHSGANLIVSGSLQAMGTLARPISFTSADATATARWGAVRIVNAAASTLQYCLLNRAGHSAKEGDHLDANTGVGFYISNSNVSILDSVTANVSGKGLVGQNSANLTLRRSQFARCVSGAEINATTCIVEDCNFSEMLKDYHDNQVDDDNDCFYIHDSGGRSVLFSRSVFANCGDDGLDGLAGSFTVEDCIIRNSFDKGVSLLQNNVTVRRSQIIDCDFGISSKTQIGDEASIYTTIVENCTIACEVHPLNTSDQVAGVAYHSVGLHARNKYGTAANAHLAFNVSNTIISAVTPLANDYATVPIPWPYTTVAYTCYQDNAGTNPADPVPPTGTGVVTADPLFVSPSLKNFHLQATSPCRDTGDPALTDPDSTRLDMGAMPYSATGVLTWTAAGGPYRLTAATTVPNGVTLAIEPGTSVYFDAGVRMTVNGRILAQGTPALRIKFSHVPGTVAAGDCDPIKVGVQTGPAKWGGLRIVDSLSLENIVANVDFINAQGTSPIDATEADQENWGSIGSIRSWVWVDGCTWTGSHLRWCYGRCAKLTVSRCNFGDMFNPLDDLDSPPSGFISGADNKQEPLKVEYKSTDAALTGNANFVGGFPVGGYFRVYANDFHGNKGHNDVFDGDGGQVGVSFPLDCRYNYFHGLTGDEHMDLKGDALIAHNIMEHGTKDRWTSDTGYSNAISTDGLGGSIPVTDMIARNLVFDMDHLINCKLNVAAIVEHNTIANMHADFHYTDSAFGIDQQVKCSVVNMMVENDAGNSPPRGDGCYLGYNVISNVPRLISSADKRQAGTKDVFFTDVTTRVQFNQNIVDQITDTVIGANHPGGIFNPAYGVNTQSPALFVDPANKNYSLKTESLAKGAGPGGMDLGFGCPEWAYIAGGPNGTTDATTATFTIGGPGLIAYKYRLDGGAYSAQTTIGTGAIFNRSGLTVRDATLTLTSLTPGLHTLEVLGMDYAGNWQNADPAKTYLGLPQFAPTSRTWTVGTALPLVINEVLAENVAAHNNGGTFPDYVEIHNPNATSVSLNGWMLSDNSLKLNKYVFPAATTIPANGYMLVYCDGPAATPGLHATFSLKGEEGEAVYLSQSGVVKDSIVYGRQIPDYSIGRLGTAGTWSLNVPTPGAANTAARLGEPTNVRINEWLASSDIRFNEDWIELYNPSTLPVSLSGLSLTDNVANAFYHTLFPPLSFMAPGYGKFTADASPTKGANHLSFQLNQFTDELALYAGSTQLQRVRVDPQVTDVSQGLVTTGGVGGLDYFVLPTDTLPNGTGDPAYANALAILNGLRITEIMYHHPLGDALQYVELTNTGATTLNLAGVSFTNGIDFTFPLGFTLAAGAQCVVAANVDVFTARYGSGTPIAGTFIGNLDNSGETLAITLAPPFDANILSFDYRGNWYAAADGGGGAILLVSNTTAISDFKNRSSWTSTALGGSPAGLATQAPPQTGYTAWRNYYGGLIALADEDFDGIDNLMEYSVGTDYTKSSTTQYLAPNVPADDHLRVNFTLPQTSVLGGMGLPDIHYIIQAGDDLNGWTTIAEKLPTSATWTGTATVTIGTASGGRIPVTVRDPQATAGQNRRFMSLKVQTVP